MNYLWRKIIPYAYAITKIYQNNNKHSYIANNILNALIQYDGRTVNFLKIFNGKFLN